MSFKTVLFLSVICAVMFSSCRTAVEDNEPVKLRDFAADDEKAAEKLASGFAEAFAKSIADGKFSHWQRHIPSGSAGKIGEKEFDAMKKELTAYFGNFEKSTYFGDVITGDLRSYLWKLRFSREENGKKIINEAIFFVRVFCEVGKTPAISRFGVKRF